MAQNKTPEQTPGGETKAQQTGKDGRKSFPIWIGAFVIVLVLAVGGYLWLSQKQVPKTMGPLEKLTIAVGTGPPVSVVLIASAKGHFENQGLDVTLQPHTSGKAALNSVLEGKADLATTAVTPIMLAVLSGRKIYVIGSISSSSRDLAIVARKERGISNPGDLKGKKVGVALGTSGHFFLDTFLISHGISRDETRFVNLKPNKMVDALLNGEIDAISTWNPDWIRAQEELGNKGVTFYSELYTATFNIVGAQDFVSNNPQIITKTLRALVKAAEFIDKDPNVSRDLIADSTKVDRTLLKRLWPLYDFRVTLDQSLLLVLTDQARWTIKNKLGDKRQVPNFLDYIYLDGLQGVKPEAVSIIR